MNERSATDEELAAIQDVVARLRAGIIAVVVGLFSGTGLAVATLWLVVRDGPNVGQHLSLLRNYFPGYSVSILGAFVGFVYAALAGAALGWSTAWLYNRFAGSRRQP